MLRKRQTINLDKAPIDLDAQIPAASGDSAADDPNSTIGKAKLIEDGRAFFCSELVAKAYKVCGIMRQTNEACTNFLPGDLSSAKNRFNLVDGATLDNEQLILTDTMYEKNQEQITNDAK